MAGAFATAPSSASARPFLSTTTIGLPTAATASASALLRLGDDDFGARLRLARHVLRFADREHDDVGPARRRDRLRDAACDRFFGPRTLGHDQRGFVGQGRSHAGCEVDRLGVVAIDAPRADQVVLAARERADERDRLARPRQRQQVAVILQQHDRFAPRFARQRARCREHRARPSPASRRSAGRGRRTGRASP